MRLTQKPACGLARNSYGVCDSGRDFTLKSTQRETMRKGLQPPPPSPPWPPLSLPLTATPHYTLLPVLPNKSKMRSAFRHMVLAPFLRVVNGLSKTVTGFNYQTHNQFWAKIPNKIISYGTPRPVISLSALDGFENSK